MPAPSSPLLEVRRVSKRYPGVQALRSVCLRLEAGEVLALLGENGAGKSTLMKILAGVQRPDAGELLIDGCTTEIASPDAALDLGIALIHQELNLADNLSVGANIFLGREPRRFGLIDKRRIARDASSLIKQVGLDVSPNTLVHRLSIGQQQLVEIAKALSVNARILIMDEPTSSLSQHETEALFRVVKDLRGRGVGIVYISHRLGEVKELADRAVVLRDGENAGELQRDEIDHDRMVRLMIGRELAGFGRRQSHTPGEIVLRASNLETPANPGRRLSFALKAGEIVGVAGLVGAGRTELLQVLFGVDRPLSGTIEVGGRPVVFHAPHDAIRAGLALVPEDRKQQGLVLEMTIRENVCLASLDRYDRAVGFRNRSHERQAAADSIRRLNIKAPHDRQVVRLLSGGNQQKVVLGKWLLLKPRVLLLDEPTRGIDVGAKQEVYQLMEQLAGEGAAILFVSSELEEILRMSDRTLVMHEGRISGELDRARLSEEAVMRLATRG